jgi:hypothetical protein
MKTENHQQVISITSRGDPMPDDLRRYMESDEDIESTALNLNLFTAKILLSRYHATFRYERNEDRSENLFLISFPEKKM